MRILRDTLRALEVGDPTRLHNLAVFPLLRSGDGDRPGYLTLDEALAAELAVVTEVSEGGHVPELRFENRSTERVLLFDGEELVGAKQNRVLNLTILVGPHKRVVIPVSCVERGRWSWRSRRFSHGKRHLFAGLRAKKMAAVSASLRGRVGPRANQGTVWAEIAAKQARMKAFSPTEAVESLYQKRAERLDDFKRGFAARPDQVGGLFCIDGRIAGLELFDHPATFARLRDRLVESYALDAVDRESPVETTPAPAEVRAWLLRLAEAPGTSHPGVDLGEDLRLTAPGLEAAALVADDRVVHLSAFPMAERPTSSEWP